MDDPLMQFGIEDSFIGTQVPISKFLRISESVRIVSHKNEYATSCALVYSLIRTKDG